MLKPILILRQVAIGYLNLPLITNMDLELIRGTHLAIVGLAGSGKTALLNTIAGNLQSLEGDVIHHRVNDDDDTKKRIAFVPSRHHFRDLSNTKDLYYQQRYNSTDSDDSLTVNQYLQKVSDTALVGEYWNIDKAMDQLRLTALADKQLIKLSNGETKRLMIAASLLKQPQLLLLDAPLNGLDVQTRSEFNSILQKISESGITIMMATGAHEIPDVFNKVALINNKEILVFDKDNFDKDNFDTDLFLTGPAERQPIDLSVLIDKYPAPTYERLISINHVNIAYGQKQILQDVSWQINQGERWALTGPNGAGKSTLLSLINGDNPQAYANDIVLFDRKRGSGESIWDIKKKTGFISPELFQYFPADSSCLHTIESGYYDTMGLFRPSDPKKVERALLWMKVLGIEPYARQLLKNIPASAQRLCLLARAMIKCPTLLILDEPTQGMDDAQVAHFKALIDTICRDTNITLIYVTHYQEHLPNSVEHVLRLAEGKIVSSE